MEQDAGHCSLKTSHQQINNEGVCSPDDRLEAGLLPMVLYHSCQSNTGWLWITEGAMDNIGPKARRSLCNFCMGRLQPLQQGAVFWGPVHLRSMKAC